MYVHTFTLNDICLVFRRIVIVDSVVIVRSDCQIESEESGRCVTVCHRVGGVSESEQCNAGGDFLLTAVQSLADLISD